MPKTDQWDALQFLHDYRIPYEREQSNWANIICPMPRCGDHKFKGGINLLQGYYHCWRCGGHPIEKVVGLLANVNLRMVPGVMAPYKQRSAMLRRLNKLEPPPLPKTIEVPGGPLKKRHGDYLRERGFSANYLKKKYSLTGTLNEPGMMRYRIVIPIFARGQAISWQARDITGESPIKYTGPKREDCPLHYKDTIYGAKPAQGSSICLVEGIFDQWRMGDGFGCTFGTSMSAAQLQSLTVCERVVFLFDPGEKEAMRHAQKYGAMLTGFGVQVEILDPDTEKDPGDFTEEEVRQVRDHIGI